MEKFISKIAQEIFDSKGDQLEDLKIILPSKRAGVFFKDALAKLSEKPIWMPKIYSIEDWLEELSGYAILDRTQLLFELYNAYVKVFPKEERDSFEAFMKWAPNLLTDFNDIDAYLEDPKNLFNYLHEAKKIESWTPLEGEPSEMVEGYLRFWDLMGALFVAYKSQLSEEGIAFQGMAYRKASDNVLQWVKENNPSKRSVYYVGFNAMNPCEENIMRSLIREDVAEVFWDVDTYYLNDNKQEAGQYLRKHKQWPEFENRKFNWISSDLKSKKDIKVYGVPKGIAQAQLAGAIVEERALITEELKDVALVLADENLMLPVLEFLPKSVKELNITMGSSLRNTNMYALFEAIFHLHLNRERLSKNSARFYYQDLFKIWQHPAIQNFGNNEALEQLKESLQQQNHSFPSKKDVLENTSEEILPWVMPILNYNSKNPIGILDDCLMLIEQIKNKIIADKKGDSLVLEQLFAFAKLFNQIENLQEKYGFIKELKTLQQLFQQSAKIESISFYGEPLSGLQLMGMLETRNLDFEHVILLSANEGFLPAGKSENSFIPFDIRKEVGLPTYMDKDAIFAYHFYRLAQRCKSLTLVYNTETDSFGSGEKSRFITQLENELRLKYPENISFSENILSHELQKVKPRELSVEKNADIQERLQEIAVDKGFSPSSLNAYKNCPLQFYYERVLQIRDPNDVEETIEANTLGTVVHRALEDFYEPHLNQLICKEDLKAMLPKIKAKLDLLFKEEFKKGAIDKGKNFLIYTVAEQFIKSFIDTEMTVLDKGTEMHIKGLEEVLKGSIEIESVDFAIKLNGSADRIDSVNGKVRIIDYKTGKVDKNELVVDEMEKLISEKKYNKGFQLYLYAYLYQQMHPGVESFEAGIITFRALKKGVLKAGFKEGKKANTMMDKDLLQDFETELKGLLAQIFDSNIPFEHKDRTEPCRFCDPEFF